MRKKVKVMETKMFESDKEVREYVNGNKQQEGYRYEVHKIDDEIYKVEKQKVIEDD